MATKKEAFLKEWESRLDKRKDEVDSLERKMREATTDGQFTPSQEEVIKLMRKHWSKSEKQLSAMAEDKDDDWERLRHKFEESLKEVESRIEKASAALRGES